MQFLHWLYIAPSQQSFALLAIVKLSIYMYMYFYATVKNVSELDLLRLRGLEPSTCTTFMDFERLLCRRAAKLTKHVYASKVGGYRLWVKVTVGSLCLIITIILFFLKLLCSLLQTSYEGDECGTVSSKDKPSIFNSHFLCNGLIGNEQQVAEGISTLHRLEIQSMSLYTSTEGTSVQSVSALFPACN